MYIYVCSAESNKQQWGSSAFDVISNDWATSEMLRLFVVEMVSTHDLYRQRKTWLAALVRAVFVLTQCNVSPVETVRELDEQMCSQWSWNLHWTVSALVGDRAISMSATIL